MIKTIQIDPLTRISGLLSVEVTIDNKKIVNATCSGQLFRGFEKMLIGRNPLDAVYFTERICGICSTAHAVASSIALEDAINIKPDYNSNLIKNFMHGCEFVQNHIRHFYLFALPDYVPLEDGVKSPKTLIPKKTIERMKDHYVLGIKYSNMAHQMLALLGGKAPHNHGILPLEFTGSLDAYKITTLKSMVKEIYKFTNLVMLTDVENIEKYYSDYYKIGSGPKNLLSFGVFDLKPAVMIQGNKIPFKKDSISEGDITAENSYIKPTEYCGKSMQVGPLSRLILNGEYRSRLSVMDRLIARAIEANKVLVYMYDILNKIQPITNSKLSYKMPSEAKGCGIIDTTRGSLGHWITIKDKVIASYNIITPSNWNLSPINSNGEHGPVEEALIGTEIQDENNPIEIGRIIRSFDPCVSCATHVITSNGNVYKYTI